MFRPVVFPDEGPCEGRRGVVGCRLDGDVVFDVLAPVLRIADEAEGPAFGFSRGLSPVDLPLAPLVSTHGPEVGGIPQNRLNQTVVVKLAGSYDWHKVCFRLSTLTMY